jgi:CTP synthase (UTP-ammonia lyase)
MVPAMSTHLNVAVIGELDPAFEPHRATNAALVHSARRLGIDAHVRWHATDDVGDLEGVDAILCSPGSPYRSLSGALAALRHGRERGVPTLGTCGGFQHMVLEYARNVLGFEDAAHAEYDPDASLLFLMPLACSPAGKALPITLTPGTRAAELYDAVEVVERHYCSFGINPDYRDALIDGGLRVAGVDEDGDHRILELPEHPFYVATLFVPQMRSTADRPHPLVTGFLEAALVPSFRV